MFLIIVFMEFPSGSMHKMTGYLFFVMFGLGYGMVWYGVVWCGMVWGMVNVVWYGLEKHCGITGSAPPPIFKPDLT